MTNVLIVEDERLTADAFKAYILSAPERYRIVRVIRNAVDAELVLLKEKIDLIIMGICTMDSSGLEVSKKLKQKYPETKIIIVTSTFMLFSLEEAKAAGIESFWHKEVSEEYFLEVMDRTMAGEHVYLSEMQDVMIGCCSCRELSLRQLQTLYYLIKVKKVSAVAEKMKCSEAGIRKHISEIKDLTGIYDTGELLRMVEKEKLILPDFMDEEVFRSRYRRGRKLS